MPGRVTIVVMALALAGCRTCPDPVEVPVPVEIPGPVQYAPLPSKVTADCGAAPELRGGMTGGELIEAARAWRARARCRDGQIESVRRLGRL